jgi:nucleotide-binding universal stress UspA family protein
MARPVAFDRVLCPTDFSGCSSAAADYAGAVANASGGHLRLLHVIAPFPITAPYLDVPAESRLWETAQAQGREALASEAARVRRAGLTVDVEHRTGPPVQEILRAAAEWPADVLVIGTHGRGGFERLVLGSVAEKVLRMAPCAVLAVPPAAAEPGRTATVRIAHVLCAHDGSAGSAAGVAYAVSLADRAGARLTLVSVVEQIPDGLVLAGMDAEAVRKDRERHAREVLDAAIGADVRVRRDVHDRIVFGHPAQQILQAAAQERPDVLVMGIQGRGAFDLMMFGSTTNHVVRNAECPVLTVRPAAVAGDDRPR